MFKQESFQTSIPNKEELIEEYLRLKHFKKELPPGQTVNRFQRLAELQEVIGEKDIEKIDAKFKKTEK